MNFTNDEALEALEKVVKVVKLDPEKEAKILANIQSLHKQGQLASLMFDLQLDILRAKNDKKYNLIAKIIENLRKTGGFDPNKINDLAMTLPDLTIEEIADLPKALAEDNNVN